MAAAFAPTATTAACWAVPLPPPPLLDAPEVPDVLGAAAPAAAAAVGPTRGEEPPAAAAAVPTVEAEAAVLLTEDVTAAANCGRVLGRCCWPSPEPPAPFLSTKELPGGFKSMANSGV